VHKSAEWHDDISEVEAMIRSAGDYVKVSRDLRPRVLDKARLVSGERRVRRYIRHVGLVAALLTWSVTATVDRMNSASDIRELTLATATAYPTVNSHVNGGAAEAAWVLVDAFTEVRGKQAEVLRLKL
jgi:hypothetical protein